MTLGTLANFRDLGGTPTGTGAIRHGRLFRADDVSTIDAEQALRLRNEGISHVIDLRGHDELASTGRGPLEHDTDYDHLPLVLTATKEFEETETDNDSPLSPSDVAHWYYAVTRDSIALLVEGISRIAATDGAVVFHCAAGKDRTGILAASVLSVLDTDDEHIINDYAASHPALPQVFERLRLAPYGFHLEAFSRAGALLEAPADTMATYLALLRTRHGGLGSLLRDRGLSEETISQLRRSLVS